MIIEKRTFHAKVGKANEVVGLLREYFAVSPHIPSAICTDLSGGTDRVIALRQHESLAAYEAARADSRPEYRAKSAELFPRLAEAVTGGEVEFLRLESGAIVAG